ncbi:melanoma antigen recognized by T-cells 1 [Rhynchonycteris naso]
MPSTDAHHVYGHPKRGHGHSYITAEEAARIGILTVILGLFLLLGCWYCRRRSGYRSLKDKRLFAGTQRALAGRRPREELTHQHTKLPFQENNYEPVVASAPPAYEKLSVQQAPPPYSP